MTSVDRQTSASKDRPALERDGKTDAKNALWPSMPWLLRSEALLRLEPWQRAEMVAVATKKAEKEWHVVAASMVYMVGYIVLWLLAGDIERHAALFIAGLSMPPLIVRVWLVRRQLSLMVRAGESLP